MNSLGRVHWLQMETVQDKQDSLGHWETISWQHKQAVLKKKKNCSLHLACNELYIYDFESEI